MISIMSILRSVELILFRFKNNFVPLGDGHLRLGGSSERCSIASIAKSIFRFVIGVLFGAEFRAVRYVFLILDGLRAGRRHDASGLLGFVVRGSVVPAQFGHVEFQGLFAGAGVQSVWKDFRLGTLPTKFTFDLNNIKK